MDGQPSTPKLSLDALVSAVLPSLDTSVVDGTRKHRRVRQPSAAPVHDSTVAAAGSEAGASAQQATATAPKPSLQPKNIPRAISSLVPDMAVAAAAAFAIPTPSTTPSPSLSVNKNVAGAIPAATATDTTATSAKKKRKNKKRKNNQGAAADSSAAEPSGETVQKATQPAKTGSAQGNASQSKTGQNKNNKRKQSHNTHGDGKDEGRFKKVHKKDTQKYVRGLDARPELVGVSKEEDFSSLLLKHVEHSNKILQRDLEMQSKKMLEDQKKQGELLAAQAALLSNPTALVPDTKKPAPEAARNQRQNQQNRNKDKAPFVPRKDCVYFLKGHCLHETSCKFKHDIEAQAAALAESKLLEAEKKKARGVCKYAIAGSCTNGDQCQFSHNLKEQPCAFYHLFGKCDTGLQCRFGHDPITEVELVALRETFKKKAEAAAELKAAQGVGAAQDDSGPQSSSVDLSHYGTQSVSIVGAPQIPAATESWSTPTLLQTGTI